MEKLLLIADCAYQPVYSLTNKLLGFKDFKVLPLSSNAQKSFKGEDHPLLIPWNRASNFSALSSIRYAGANKKEIDLAIVVFDPPPHQHQESTLSSIIAFIDSYLKSFILLLREIDLLFKKQKQGILIPILYKKEGNLTSFEKIAASAFKIYVDELIADSTKNYQIKAIDCEAKTLQEIETVLFQLMREEKGPSRWITPSSKNSFFSFFK